VVGEVAVVALCPLLGGQDEAHRADTQEVGREEVAVGVDVAVQFGAFPTLDEVEYLLPAGHCVTLLSGTCRSRRVLGSGLGRHEARRAPGPRS
jgi:hypothetical protein